MSCDCKQAVVDVFKIYLIKKLSNPIYLSMLGALLGFIIGGFCTYYFIAHLSPYSKKPNLKKHSYVTSDSTSQTKCIEANKTLKSNKECDFSIHNIFCSKYAPNPVDTKLAKIPDANSATNTSEKQTTIGFDYYLGRVTSYYEHMISLLVSVIGIVLGIGFLYVNQISKNRAEEMARSALDEESFSITWDKKIGAMIATEFSDRSIPELVAQMEEIREMEIIDRIGFLENEINEEEDPSSASSLEE